MTTLYDQFDHSLYLPYWVKIVEKTGRPTSTIICGFMMGDTIGSYQFLGVFISLASARAFLKSITRKDENGVLEFIPQFLMRRMTYPTLNDNGIIKF